MLPWLQRRWRTGQLRSIDGGEQNALSLDLNNVSVSQF